MIEQRATYLEAVKLAAIHAENHGDTLSAVYFKDLSEKQTTPDGWARDAILSLRSYDRFNGTSFYLDARKQMQ